MANKDVHLREEALLLMQSSAAVAGRALIMLACVVGIPAVALSGASWSEMLKKLQDVHWATLLDWAQASGSASLAEAARFAPSSPVEATAMAAGPARPTRAQTPALLGSTPVSAAEIPARTVAPSGSAVMPAGYQMAVDPPPTAPPAAGGGEDATLTPAGSTAACFRSIQDRLRQLGATYYLLESWGTGQQTYRFYCKMAVGGSRDYTRCFEAIDGDPLQAMRLVLQQVETQHGK